MYQQLPTRDRSGENDQASCRPAAVLHAPEAAADDAVFSREADLAVTAASSPEDICALKSGPPGLPIRSDAAIHWPTIVFNIAGRHDLAATQKPASCYGVLASGI